MNIMNMNKNATAAVFAAAVAFATHAVPAESRPYEMEWAGRTKDDRPVLLPLDSTDGWTCEAAGATAVFTTACARVLFGDGVAHLAWRNPEQDCTIKLKPASPVPLPPGSDTVSVWIWGNHKRVKAENRPVLSADFRDASGTPFSIQLEAIRHDNWFLLQRRFAPSFSSRVVAGGTFVGFTIRSKHGDGNQWIELTSLAVYKEELKPLAFKPRRKRGVQLFQDEPQGLNTGEGWLPFPNVNTTIIPMSKENSDIEFRLPSDPAKWDDLAVRHRGGDWVKFAVGGGIFPVAAAKDAKVRFHRVANSLVADIEAPAGVEEVRFGCMEKPCEAIITPVPYYTCRSGDNGVFSRPCVVLTGKGEDRLFHLASVDWTQSNASWIFPTNHPSPVASNGGVRYHPKTDGTRNPVFERFVWSFSPKFEDVLPIVPNPPSPYRAVTAERQRAVMYAGNREKDKAFWRNRHRRGIKHLIVNDHETCMRDQNESFTFRTRPAPGKGGDEGMRDFARFMIDGLGYMYGPYNNYTDFAPVNGYWSADHVSRQRDMNLQRAWNRCYAPKPAWINEACEEIWTELQRKFRFNTAYCDVHTCTAPWMRTDYDARVPGAGTFAATFYAFGELLDFERRVVGGPVCSEGGSHYMYCGLVDGNYAQDQNARLSEQPWLVDFDLLRLHPLCNNFGMGSPGMFYPKAWKVPDRVAWRDRFLAATVAFGHQGFFMKGNPEDEDQSYFMLLGTGRHYCTADAKEICYADASGNLHGTSDAVASGIYRRSQVVVRYTDGTMTAANGSTNETMKVELRGYRFTLSPNGYCAIAGDGTAAVVSGAVRNDGKRLDISVAPDYVYLNAYGNMSVSPFGGTDGRMYRLIEKDGSDEVFLRKGKIFILPYAAKSVVALDEAGKTIGSAPFEVKGGVTHLVPWHNAFSYRVEKPSGWNEPSGANVFAAMADIPLESQPVSRMESRTKDPKRGPGIFGDYWWANRFLSRHQAIKKIKGGTVDVVMIGDSIMHFWEWKHPASWAKFTAGRTVLNLGYGGDRTQNVIWRIENGELDGYEAKCVVLMIGTNNNSFDTTDPANVADAIEKIVEMIRVRQPKAKIVLHPIFPRGASAQSIKSAKARARNDKTNELLKAFAEKDGKIVWIDFNNKLIDETGWVPRTIMADETHPTDIGYDIWMNVLEPVLQ